ncbi:MAG: hypothetical protein WCK63_11710 [Betaproteobacteria bacterium]
MTCAFAMLAALFAGSALAGDTNMFQPPSGYCMIPYLVMKLAIQGSGGIFWEGGCAARAAHCREMWGARRACSLQCFANRPHGGRLIMVRTTEHAI